MNAVAVGYEIGLGYLFKCPICGSILSCRSTICPNCQAEIDSYEMYDYTTIENPKVCVDLHGVALDMLAALKVYLKQKHGINFSPSWVTDYDFKCDLGFDRQIIFDSFSDPYLHSLVRPYDDAIDAIDLLRSRCKPVAYTGVVSQPMIVASTNETIHSLGLAGQAMSYNKPVIYDAHVLFDDSPDVHRQWWSAGFPGLQYIIDHPYNQPSSGAMWKKLIRVSTLYEGVVDMFGRFGWDLSEELFND